MIRGLEGLTVQLGTRVKDTRGAQVLEMDCRREPARSAARSLRGGDRRDAAVTGRRNLRLISRFFAQPMIGNSVAVALFMRLFLAGTMGVLLVGTVAGGCRYRDPGALGGPDHGPGTGSGGMSAGGSGVGGAESDAGGVGGTEAGGGSGTGGAVGGGGTATGGGGSPGNGGAATPAGGAGGAGGAIGSICPQPAAVPGTWVEIPAPAGSQGLVARDAFAAGVDDLYFAARTATSSVSATMQVLHFSHGCWTVELTTTLVSTSAIDPNVSEPSVHGLPTGEIWVAAGDQIYRRRAAQDWTPIDASWHAQIAAKPNFGGPMLTRVRAAASDDLWATERNNILHFKGGAWTATNLDDPYYPSQSASIAFNYHDIWIDDPGSVWIAGGSDEVGSTMDPAPLHHFDGTNWSRVWVGQYDVLAMWRAGTAFWLAAPGQLANDGVQTLVRYDGSGPATAVPITGANNNGSIEFSRLWGRGGNDLWAAGNDLAHFDGTNWTLAADAPPAARVSSSILDNTFVTGDAAAVWIVTPGPRFFRKADASATAP